MPSSPSLINHVALVIDKSGSMQPHRKEVVAQFNAQLETLRQEQKNNVDQITTLNLYTFDSSDRPSVKALHRCAPILGVPDWSLYSYFPGGGTPLVDAVGTSVDDFLHLPDKNAVNVSFLVIVITDGYENSSTIYSKSLLKDLLRKVQATDRWTFAFICPPDSVDTIRALGIPSGNIQPWDGTTEQYRDLGIRTQSATRSYYDSRVKGATSSKSFFSLDLDKVKPQDLKKDLVDVRSSYQKLPVTKEIDITSFVESATHLPYVKGFAFYQLTKKEDLQDHKEILIEDRKTKAIYGGRKARSLLSLPEYGTIRLEPGNIANYNVYVQSTSVNRKLVRGTSLLVKK